ncbi:MAG TPA: HAD family hydrolase [Pseudogracilibacillus sp.]|nr:HAD family hydrolase [Pseudogracilibacillus sp.]
MKLILFDFDGTLANTLANAFHAFRRVFEAFDQVSYRDDEIEAMFGPSEVGIIEKNLKSHATQAAIDMYYDIYEKEHDHFVKADDHIIQLLEALKRKGYRLGIITSKGRRSLHISLEKLNMLNYFDDMIAYEDVSKPKPDPEGIVKLMKKYSASPNETLFFGDSDADIEAGLAAGVCTIGVSWFLSQASGQFKHKPDQSFSRIDQCLFWLGEEEMI